MKQKDRSELCVRKSVSLHPDLIDAVGRAAEGFCQFCQSTPRPIRETRMREVWNYVHHPFKTCFRGSSAKPTNPVQAGPDGGGKRRL